jgi:MSHA type pilus biogenesis protein MshL
MIGWTMKKNNRLFFGGVLILLTVCPVGMLEAKMNVADELWEEETVDLKGPETPGEEGQASPPPGGPLILDVLDLKNMDILDVLKLISQKSGLNIVAGQNVKGRVTVFLKDVEVREALRIIVEAYGWAYLQDGDIMRVMTDKEYEDRYGHRFGQPVETRVIQVLFAKPSDVVAVLNQMKSPTGKIITDQNSGILILRDGPRALDEMEAIIRKMDAPIETAIFDLSYAKAAEISAKVGEILTPSVGSMKHDERSNRIIVSDTAAKIKEVDHLVKAFDRKDKEVLIEAKIIQIALNDEHKLGVDWEAVVSDYHSLDMVSNFDVLSDTDKQGKVSIGTVATDGYKVLVEALETVGHTDILSSPRVAVVNNKEAKILVGSTEPYVTNTTTTPSSGPTTTAESVNFIEVGIKLFVTPTIHEDNFITMNIKPEVSSVVKNITTGNNNTIPVVETSEAETTVVVKDQVTIVIGGLIKEEKIKTTKKVPFLGDVPLLGVLFRSKSDVARKTEIVILLTPKIISGDAEDGGFE